MDSCRAACGPTALSAGTQSGGSASASMAVRRRVTGEATPLGLGTGVRGFTPPRTAPYLITRGERMLRDRPRAGKTPWVVRGEMFDEQGAIIAIDGEVDLATAPQLGAVIAEMLDYGHRHLVIGLTAAEFLDSTA